MSVRSAEADAAFAAIVAARTADGACSSRRMFGSPGLFAGDRLAAFVNGAGTLVVKLPPDAYRRISEASGAGPVVMRGRPMRQWLAVPLGAADWPELVDLAIGYVREP